MDKWEMTSKMNVLLFKKHDLFIPVSIILLLDEKSKNFNKI